MSTAGGELFGGVLMSIAGLSTILLLLTARTPPIEARKRWAAASVFWLLLGGLFGASGYRKVDKDIVERRQVHENLKAIKEKLEAIEASGKKWDPVAGEFR
jgi:membrane protein required for beta-lactamase induction